MARKRKTNEESEAEYDVLVGFIHEFKFHSEEDITRLSGHPIEGRVYRLLKDPYGWRVHIGRENNKEGLDGLYLGDQEVYEISTGLLKSEQRRYNYKIEIITPTNYLNLPLVEEDRARVLEWIQSDNTDLWEGLKREQSGEVPVIRTGTDLLKLLMNKASSNGHVKEEAVKSPTTTPRASAETRERALEATLTLMTHFPEKPVVELVALYDAMFSRILTTLVN